MSRGLREIPTRDGAALLCGTVSDGANQPLAERTTLVTGVSSGTGEATARALVAHGATVLLAARREERREAIAEPIRTEADGGVDIISTDIRGSAAVTAAVEGPGEQFGGPDIAIPPTHRVGCHRLPVTGSTARACG